MNSKVRKTICKIYILHGSNYKYSEKGKTIEKVKISLVSRVSGGGKEERRNRWITGDFSDSESFLYNAVNVDTWYYSFVESDNIIVRQGVHNRETGGGRRGSGKRRYMRILYFLLHFSLNLKCSKKYSILEKKYINQSQPRHNHTEFLLLNITN